MRPGLMQRIISTMLTPEQIAALPRVNSDDLYLEQIKQAVAMTFEERFFAGCELFNAACDLALAGIRMNRPGLSDEEALVALKRRFAIADTLALHAA